jgi:hypothetical protein
MYNLREIIIVFIFIPPISNIIIKIYQKVNAIKTSSTWHLLILKFSFSINSLIHKYWFLHKKYWWYFL